LDWVFVPAQTPDTVVFRLNAEINEALKRADVPEKLQSIGFDVITTSPTEAMDYFKSEVANRGQMAHAIGFSID
jgi:tripartite-type tricarboxylate transporter receptor subunit TctC